MSSSETHTPPAEHRERFLVRSYEVEPDGRLRVVVLMRMLQEAAWQHASLLGKGFHHRSEGALFWVLTAMRLRIDRYPRWGEHVTVRTFPVGTQKLLAIREFVLLDEADAVLGRASSGWLIVDGGTGRPLRPQPVVADLVTTASEFNADLSRSPPLEAGTTTGSIPVRYHDIDQYRHVNNAAYLEWVVDAIESERSMTHEIAGLSIDFLKETVLGDSYTVTLSRDADIDRFEVARHPGAAFHPSPATPPAISAPAPPNPAAGAPDDHAPPTAEPAARGHLVWRPLNPGAPGIPQVDRSQGQR